MLKNEYYCPRCGKLTHKKLITKSNYSNKNNGQISYCETCKKYFSVWILSEEQLKKLKEGIF